MTQDIPRPIGMIDMFGKTKWGGVVACCSHQVAEEQADGKQMQTPPAKFKVGQNATWQPEFAWRRFKSDGFLR